MSVSVIGDWGREKREALEQLCFSFAPGKLLENQPHSKEKKIFASHQNMPMILSPTSYAKVL